MRQDSAYIRESSESGSSSRTHPPKPPIPSGYYTRLSESGVHRAKIIATRGFLVAGKYDLDVKCERAHRAQMRRKGGERVGALTALGQNRLCRWLDGIKYIYVLGVHRRRGQPHNGYITRREMCASFEQP